MRLALYFLLFSIPSFVSGLRNVTLDDNDRLIIYSPGWNVSSGNDSFDFGGSLHFSDNATASASLTFQGVAVYLMAPFWATNVGAQVVLDDQDPIVIDLGLSGAAVEAGLSQEIVQSSVIWAATGLDDTQHTIVISMPASARHVVMDGLIYSVKDSDNAASVPFVEASTSFTTITTTERTTSTGSFSSSPLASAATPLTTTTTASSSSSSSASSRLFSSAAPPIENVIATSSSLVGAPVTTISEAPQANNLSASNTSIKHTIAVASTFGALLVISVLVVLFCCLRHRRIQRRRREQLFTWSHKFTPYPAPQKDRPARVAAARPSSLQPSQARLPRSPFTYTPPSSLSPASAGPLVPPPPPTAARRAPAARSPLATAPPIVPPSPSPSPRSSHFPPSPASASGPGPVSPTPTTPTPLLLTPPPPATPGTPWSPQKSHHHFSTASSSESSSCYDVLPAVESGAGYGWTTPSLVGIHPFSAGTGGAPVVQPSRVTISPLTTSTSASTSTPTSTVGPTPPTPPPVVDTVPLTPMLSEKSAAALFHVNQEAQTRLSLPAPAYKEKDARRLFANGRGHTRAGSASSEAAPPLYEP